jgi:hypothetical protein
MRRLRRQPGAGRKLAAGQELLSGIVLHETILVPAPGARSTPLAVKPGIAEPKGPSSPLHAEGAVGRACS